LRNRLYTLASARTPALSQTPVIAIVDDDGSVREAMRGLLRAVGYATEEFPSAEEFLQSKRLDDAACLITDLQLGGMSGLELQKHLTGLGSRIPIIVISAFSDERERALIAGAIDFLGKPVMKEDLLRCIRVALER
jgi:FixJ family two-component response regulator